MKNLKKKNLFINSEMFILGKPPPRLPRSMLQKAWGVDVYWINEYIDFDENDCCTIGGNKLGVSIRILSEKMGFFFIFFFFFFFLIAEESVFSSLMAHVDIVGLQFERN